MGHRHLMKSPTPTKIKNTNLVNKEMDCQSVDHLTRSHRVRLLHRDGDEGSTQQVSRPIRIRNGKKEFLVSFENGKGLQIKYCLFFTK
ncbi:hypothetical protein TNCT_513231 [Trichonephila clavata]|uniref:Uncharacterized protein n=1 Tax=Trichonephila clavata TaxID=2740835 RepID=A0A8X6H761_TRICU|nr:hypothetical protein TNCT_513231 [Trichonephila clavata]